jgi:hypothetical protein
VFCLKARQSQLGIGEFESPRHAPWLERQFWSGAVIRNIVAIRANMALCSLSDIWR